MEDSQASGDDCVSADWAELAGRPATPESLLALTGADPAGMTGAALVDAIVASEKALSLLAGTQMRLLAALAVPFVAGDPMRLAAVLARRSCITGDDDPDQVAHYVPEAAASMAAAEVAAALRIPSRTAGVRVAEADTMTGVLGPTLDALEQGVLDRAKARVIADHCQPLSPEQTQDLQDLVLPGVGGLTTSELRDVAGQAVIIVDPDGAEHRHQEAAARRDLQLHGQPDGMATLKANLPADGAVKIFQVSDLLATGTAGTPGDSRGIGARRVDALVDIADHLLTHGFVDLTDYLGQELPDHGTPTTCTRRPNPDTTSTETNGASTNGTQASTGSTGGTGAENPDASSDTTSTNGTQASTGSTGGTGAENPDASSDTTSTNGTQASTGSTGGTGAENPDASSDTTSTNGTDASTGSTGGTGAESADASSDITGTETPDVSSDVVDAENPDTSSDVTDAEATVTPDAAADGSASSDTEPGSPANPDVGVNIDTEAPGDVFATADTDADASTDATPEFTTDTDSDADTNESTGNDDPTASIPAGEPGTATAATGSAARRGGNRVFTRQGRRPHLSVTIGLSTLAGLDNLPGTLAGFGAIPAGLARSIAASAATINALITDPDTGLATAAGALTYRPTQELRDQTAALLNVCQFPSCRQPAWRCDLDHRESFNHQHPDRGGPTAITNTGPLCRRHHLMKHHTGWRIRIDPTRTTVEWTSPTGHTYRNQGRQVAVPGLWVSTAATAIAERLDHIATPPSTLVHRDTDEPAPTSHIDDLLAAILIRHHLNTKTIEIDYHPATAWETVDLDDPPPF